MPHETQHSHQVGSGGDQSGQPAGAGAHHPPSADTHPYEPHDVERLNGVGVYILHCSERFSIFWVDGSTVVLRLGQVSIDAHAGEPERGFAHLRLNVRMVGRPDLVDQFTAVLPFHASDAPELRRLADKLRGSGPQASEAPPVEAPAQVKEPTRVREPAPAREGLRHGEPDGRHPPSGTPPASLAKQPELPIVRIEAGWAIWAKDSDWVGLAPPTETRRLLLRSGEPSLAPQHPHSM